MNAGDWAQLGTAAFAAVAAGASWAAVRQTRREWRQTQAPELHMEVTEVAGSGAVELHIENSGGLAKSVSFAVVSGSHACVGFVGPNLMLQNGQALGSLLVCRPETRTKSLAL